MNFATQCSECGHQLNPPIDKIGKKGPCPGCRVPIILAKGTSYPEQASEDSISIEVEDQPEPELSAEDFKTLEHLQAKTASRPQPTPQPVLPESAKPEPVKQPESVKPEPASPYAAPLPMEPPKPKTFGGSNKNPYWAVQTIAAGYQAVGLIWMGIGVLAFIFMIIMSFVGSTPIFAGLLSAGIALVGNLMFGTLLVAAGQMFQIVLAIEQNTRKD